MKVLISGAQGFLGKRVLDYCLAAGHDVVAVSRRPWPKPIDNVAVEVCDLGNLDGLRQIFKKQKIDAVIHCAAKSGVWGPLNSYMEANFITTLNMVEAARQGGAVCFIHTSSPSVVHNGFPLDGVDESAPYTQSTANHYPYSKMMAERLVLSANNDNFRCVCLRPHLIWGPGDPHFLPRIIQKARKNRLWLIRSEALIDAVYIDNAASAHLLALEQLADRQKSAPAAGQAYFITQGEPITASKLVEKILTAAAHSLGERLGIRGYLPPWLAYPVASLMESIWKIASFPNEPPLTRFVAEELTLPHWFKIDRAKKDLGYEVKISMEEGLKILSSSKIF